MRTVIITIKRNGYIHFKFMFSKKKHGDGVGNQKYCRNETVLLGTQNIKPWLQIELTRLRNFVMV